jgi:hypothetical protein
MNCLRGKEAQMAQMNPLPQRDPMFWLEQIQHGMKVVDAAGENVGSVDYVKMGDPEAVTDRGEVSGEPSVGFGAEPRLGGDGSGIGGGGIGAPVFWPGGGGEPNVPEPIYSRLIRDGYFKISGHFLGKSHYAEAGWVAGVNGDTVTLNVPRDRLPVAGEGFDQA